MSYDYQQQIKIIDFRNARYQGTLSQSQDFHGLGILLDDQYMLTLSRWQNGGIDGPCFVMFPNEQIFYGKFRNGMIDGICCFDTTDSCRIFCNFENGQIVGNASSIFEGINYIVEISVSEKGGIDVIQEIDYGSKVDNIDELDDIKWEITQRIIKSKLSGQQRSLKKFIKANFVAHFPYQLDEYAIAVKNEYFFGFKDQGLGIKFEQGKLKSVGYFNEAKIMQLMGKKVINRSKQIREEGIYDTPDSLLRYQQLANRPNQARKTLRNYYRKSLDFINSFIKVDALTQLQHLFTKIKVNIKENTINKIAQQLLENPIPLDLSKAYNLSKIQTTDPNKETIPQDSTPLYQVPKEEASLQRLKEELNRTISKKNTSFSYMDDKSRSYLDKSQSRSRSPYRQMEMQVKPAELSYTSKTRPPIEEKNEERKKTVYSPINLQRKQMNKVSLTDVSPRKTGIVKQIHQRKSPGRKVQQSNKNNHILYDYDQLHEERYKKELKSPHKYRPNQSRINQIANIYDQCQSREERLETLDRLMNKNKNYQYIEEESGKDYNTRTKSPYRTGQKQYHYRDHQFKENPELTGLKYASSRKIQVPQRSLSPYERNKTKYYADNLDRTASYYPNRYH